MLVIRMQRTGRSGHAQFRVVVQDSRRTPTSGKVVASLGHFNPHTKITGLDKEKATFYLEHGAQPSERVIRLLKAEGVKLPKWVDPPAKKTHSIKNTEKLRKNRTGELAPIQTVKSETVEGETPETPSEAADTVAVADTAETEVASEAAVSQAEEPEQTENPAPDDAGTSEASPETAAETEPKDEKSKV